MGGGGRKPWKDLTEAERELARKANASKECTAWKRFGNCRFGDACMFKHDLKSKGKDKKKGSVNVAVNEAKEEKKTKRKGKEEEDADEEESEEEERQHPLIQLTTLRPAIKKQRSG